MERTWRTPGTSRSNATCTPSDANTGKLSSGSFGSGPAVARASWPASMSTSTRPATTSASCRFTPATVRPLGQESIKPLKGHSVQSPSNEQRIHLHDVQGRQVLRPGTPGAREHLALVPPGREDRRARPERRRQVDRAADHGRASRSRRPASPSSPRVRASACSSRSPSSIPTRDVRGNVEDGVRALRDLLDRFNEISAAFAEPDADFDALLAEQAKVQEQIDRADAWQLDSAIDHAMDALRLPEGDRDVDDALRRRAAARRALPPAALRARPAAARRADEPSRRRVGRVARALPRRLQGHRRRRHARPVLPRQRRRLDPRARPRQGHSVRGQLLVVARAEAGAPRRSRRSRTRRAERTLARELEWVRMSPRARHAKSKARLGGLREDARRRAELQARQVEIHIPPGPRLGDLVDRGRRAFAKGFGDKLLVRGS